MYTTPPDVVRVNASAETCALYAAPCQYQHVLSKGHALLDLSNRKCWVQSLRACPAAVQNGVASVQAHAVVEGVLSLGSLLVTGVGNPAVGLQEDGGTEVLFAVPPVRWAGCRAAGAENTFVETVELAAVGLGLAVLLALCNRLALIDRVTRACYLHLEVAYPSASMA